MRPNMVILHYTAMQSAQEALERLCSPLHEVSAHYLIDRVGQQYQLVDEAHRAWHAGVGGWGRCFDINSASIGIELCNSGEGPYTGAQMGALAGLLRTIMRRWDIPKERIIGHSDIALGRKVDPGAHFDWQWLAAQGLAVWSDQLFMPKPQGAGFWHNMAQIGYVMGAETTDADALQAFRLRFAPQKVGRGGGSPDGEDIQMAACVAARYPVDLRIKSD